MSGADTRERILEAACSLFAAQGYDGTSTRQVGVAAGANIGTIAYHFGGKEGLYHATLGRMYERVLALDVPDAAGVDAAEGEAVAGGGGTAMGRAAREGPATRRRATQGPASAPWSRCCGGMCAANPTPFACCCGMWWTAAPCRQP